MCILCLPQVDTHYPNMVKIEIDLYFAHTHKHTGPQSPVFSSAEQIFQTTLQSAFSVTSHRKQETQRFPHFLCLNASDTDGARPHKTDSR